MIHQGVLVWQESGNLSPRPYSCLCCDAFLQEMWALDKEVRSWNVYKNLELTIKNLLTSLKVVTELQNPAMRDRHWFQLMDSIGVSIFVMHFGYIMKYVTYEKLD